MAAKSKWPPPKITSDSFCHVIHIITPTPFKQAATSNLRDHNYKIYHHKARLLTSSLRIHRSNTGASLKWTKNRVQFVTEHHWSQFKHFQELPEQNCM